MVLLLVLIAWLVTSRQARVTLSTHRRVITLALIPSLGVMVVWFVTAPDPRFAWGPLLLIALIPLSFLVSTNSRRGVWPAVLASASMVIVAVAMARGSLLEVSLHLKPLPDAAVESGSLIDGTRVVVPVEGDQCWGEFPLCRPWYSTIDVELRGDTWQSGFQPMSLLKDSHE